MGAAIGELIESLTPKARVLDIGAGSGDIALTLAPRVGRYVALDASAEMLRVLQQRLSDHELELLHQDANQRWEVEASSIDVIVACRSLHWLEPSVLARQASRVLGAEGWLICGRVRRNKDHPASRLRRALHAALRRRGLRPRRGETALDACARELSRSFELAELPPVIAARWTRSHSAARQIAQWRDKPGLAGLELEPATKQQVLSEVDQVLDAAHVALEHEEAFALEVLRLSRSTDGKE